MASLLRWRWDFKIRGQGIGYRVQHVIKVSVLYLAFCILNPIPNTLYSFVLPAEAVVYLSKEEALQRAYPEAERFETRHWVPSAIEREVLEKAFGRKIVEQAFTFHIAKQKEKIFGTAIVLDEIGKHKPITFLVAMDPEGKIKDLYVLEFRESRGSDIRRRGFLKQYIGKGKADGFQIGKDIDTITGATLSGLATSLVARKALLLWEAFFQKKEFPHVGRSPE